MSGINVNGEIIPVRQAQELVRMLCNDAKQIAGVFHGMDRSAKFRANWPDEYLFADANWKSFMEAARAMYAQRLADPKTDQGEARKMHLALVIEQMIAQGVEKDTRLQLSPNTQQFVGDRRENAKTIDKFGKHSNTAMELLMSTCRPRERFH